MLVLEEMSQALALFDKWGGSYNLQFLNECADDDQWNAAWHAYLDGTGSPQALKTRTQELAKTSASLAMGTLMNAAQLIDLVRKVNLICDEKHLDPTQTASHTNQIVEALPDLGQTITAQVKTTVSSIVETCTHLLHHG